jgi:hypothetical protein
MLLDLLLHLIQGGFQRVNHHPQRGTIDFPLGYGLLEDLAGPPRVRVSHMGESGYVVGYGDRPLIREALYLKGATAPGR